MLWKIISKKLERAGFQPALFASYGKQIQNIGQIGKGLLTLRGPFDIMNYEFRQGVFIYPMSNAQGRYLRKTEKKKLPIPGWLFVVFSIFYNELVLHLWVADGLNVGRFLGILAFALGLGSMLSLLISLITHPKAEKWVTGVFTFLLAVIYLVEYFLFDAYKTFMTLAAVANGAGGVATGYLETVLSLLANNWWRIVLMLLPVILYLIFAGSKRANWKARTALGVSAVVMYLLGYGAVWGMTNDLPMLNPGCAFDTAVRSFGLNVALGLDAAQQMGFSQQEMFVPLATLPQTTEPVQTEPDTDALPDATEPDATQPPETEPPITGDNVLDVDFAALAETEENKDFAAINSYLASVTPSKKNEYTGMFKGKNLILITAEALHSSIITPEFTPTLYRLATEGIHFKEYYQPVWGGGTTSGEFTNLMGLYPADGVGCMNELLEQDMFFSIGNQLQDLGYFSRAYHNNDFEYYNRDETHVRLGYDEFIGYGNGIEEGVSKAWPESDLEMMQFTVDQYIDQQPFSIYYMTVSGHCTYSTRNNSMSRKNYDAVKDLNYSETVKSYIACNLELEYGMAHLVARLEEAGIADDTVIVLTTDHYPYGLAPSDTWSSSRDYLKELGASSSNNLTRDAAPLIIWSGCLEDQDIVVDEPVFSLDILPTISNLFGIDYDSRILIGRDVFAGTDPLVFWIDNSWKTDKGYYEAPKGKFTPNEGVTVEEGYVDYVKSLVKNKIAYSRNTQWKNYFDYIKPYLGE